MKIGNHPLGPEYPPLVIAEMSGNHNGSIERALDIIDTAADSGVKALKFQTYTPDTITIDCHDEDFFIGDKASPWYGQSMYELYEKAHTPWEWHEELFARCHERGVMPFSAAFDSTAVDFLEKLNVPCHKIASPENVDIPLIRKAAKTGKPLLISTGMASIEELDEAVSAARDAGCRDILLLKCTTEYPAATEDMNLRTIPDMKARFGVEVGLSDHSLGIGVAIASVALGAVAIEKHFTLSRNDGGVDAEFSMEPKEMQALVAEVARAHSALGKIHYGPAGEERKSMTGRRSLYIVKDMEAGDFLSPENMRSIRPGHGLLPKHYYALLGRRIKEPVKRGTPISWDFVE